MSYVDGYVLVIKKGGLADYKKMAAYGGKVWKKNGALQYFECVGEDLEPKMNGMKISTFTKLTKAKPGEKIIFAFVVYKNKKHRDSVNKKVQKEMDEDMKKNKEKWKNTSMPFDMKRMSYGGFETIVEK